MNNPLVLIDYFGLDSCYPYVSCITINEGGNGTRDSNEGGGGGDDGSGTPPSQIYRGGGGVGSEGGLVLDPKSRCAKLFQQMFHMTPSQFNSKARNLPWFYSPNANTFGITTWNDIAGNGDNRKISDSFSGTSIEAVTASGGAVGAPVVLGPDWFLDSPDRQKAVKLHEATHSITGWDDADIFNVFSQYGLPDANFQQFGNTDDFTIWLLNRCPSK